MKIERERMNDTARRFVERQSALHERLRRAWAGVECPTRKRQFKKRREAQSEATRLNRSRVFDRGGKQVEPYVCNACGKWHIGRPTE